MTTTTTPPPTNIYDLSSTLPADATWGLIVLSFTLGTVGFMLVHGRLLRVRSRVWG